MDATELRAIMETIYHKIGGKDMKDVTFVVRNEETVLITRNGEPNRKCDLYAGFVFFPNEINGRIVMMTEADVRTLGEIISRIKYVG